MIYVIIAIVTILILLIAIEEILSKKRGDCRFEIDLQRVEECLCYQNETEIQLSFSVPMKNTGRQQGLLIDCKSELQPEGDTFKDIFVHSKIINKASPRLDDYWEANIIKPGQECWFVILLKIRTSGQDSEKIGKALDSFIIDILLKYYGRSLMTYEKQSVRLELSRFSPSRKPLDVFGEKAAGDTTAERRPVPEQVVPVKTHLLRPSDDLVGVIQKYTEGIAYPGDIIAIAESAVAIMQGRVYYVEEIHPRFLARKINRLFARDSSLSSPYSLEMAFREVGVMRIILATIAGVLGKMIGRSGDFYRVAGKLAATIDDCTGTIPPYDKCVVLGPSKVTEVVKTIREKTGLEAAVVDVNDLGKVDVLAVTNTAHIPYLQKSLERNPAGNANEQTPIVLIRAPGKPDGVNGKREPR